MSSATELAELHDLIGGLRRCVSSMKARYGDSDASELDVTPATVQQSSEKIVIPDTDYDRDFWRDVDQEGVGGHHRS